MVRAPLGPSGFAVAYAEDVAEATRLFIERTFDQRPANITIATSIGLEMDVTAPAFSPASR